MENTINIQEILIVNITGAVLLLILPFLQKGIVKGKDDDRLFCAMSWISVVALVVEIVTFFIDGKPGSTMRILAYLLNGYLFLASALTGVLWVLYVDFSIYRSRKRLRQLLFPMALPFVCVGVLVLLDFFGMGIIFSITPENVYVRGRFVSLSYIVLFFYIIYGIVSSIRAIKKNGHILFPVHFFMLPCMVGMLLQGMCYGITLGWFSVSIAFLLAQMQTQNFKAYVDDLSGLYNRRYYNYYINRVAHSERCHTLSGIMMDINEFKQINDRFGHVIGDDAIRSTAKILTKITSDHNTAFRLSGDEFAIVSENLSFWATQQLLADLQRELEAFNEKGEKPYQLSLAVGYLLYDTENFNSDAFFHQMDTKMYESKAAYYAKCGRERRR